MTLSDYVAVIFLSGLITSLAVRLLTPGRGSTKTLLICQCLVVYTVTVSLSFVFPVYDAMLGGRSYANLLSHLVLILVYALLSREISRPFLRGGPVPLLLRNWVFITAAIGTVLSFASLSIGFSSRGADEFIGEIGWIAYWLFSTMGLWLVAFQMVPLLVKARRNPRLRKLRSSYFCLMLGYAMSVLMAVGYILTWVDPDLVPVREVVVLLTMLALVISLILVPFAKHRRLNAGAGVALGQHRRWRQPCERVRHIT
ncbi:hypothetical protein NBM05_03865 [Rothia sp. AR01]|uniref:Uncharacterized protein n=1 Tax=Rothia santali TaxID=2949643 RepID=A0A9X2KHV2_9MICC|nr:hypothetical protein [Rothia santali]MCP3425184.1 hypothetical protein [Rothia santali]